VDLPDDVFAVEVSEALLWEQVRAQRASARAGTHKTKKVGEVSGTNAKPYKQKGTGRARQGSQRSPQFVGGGTVFGPQPRDYSYRLPRSARRAALRSALSARAKDGLIVVDEFALDAPKTKTVVNFLATLGTKRALLVDTANDVLAKSTNNVPGSKFIEAGSINVYDILDHEKLVLTKESIELIVAKVKKQAKSAGGAS
jgi:large subunit ribosomal protein L4